jgi:Transient receptor potential (TRP) ion channel
LTNEQWFRTDPKDYPSFSINHNFESSYAFTTFQSTFLLVDGSPDGGMNRGCVSANVTPYLGSSVGSVIRYLPLVILILVGISVIAASIFSPWGSSNTFRWTSNFSRDPDLLRLVTPGFGDCLQYIQFVVLTGALSLNYPGYFQPVVSRASWSILMFNTSLVSHGNGTQSLIDGIYVTNGTYGLDRLSQLVGLSTVQDIWAGTATYTAAIAVGVVVLIQLGFLGRLGHRHFSKSQQEDLRSKNLQFTLGNVLRIIFIYFLLPGVSLTFFQFVVAASAPTFVTALAAVFLIIFMAVAGWICYKVFSVRPRSQLFDDLPMMLLYGPLYNTYADNAAPFTLIPMLLTFIKGVAIGAVQHSGIAQVVLLAICEVILILTLNAFRPFAPATFMNLYHTIFASFRLASLLLMVAFVPSLGVTEAPKGVIGYVILLMHAVILVFGFLLNVLQHFLEVAALASGAGGEDGSHGAATRGGLVKVLGMRQLSRRMSRREGGHRHESFLPTSPAIPENDRRSQKSRSMSGSSTILLNNRSTPASDGRRSAGPDSILESAGLAHAHSSIGSAAATPRTPGTGSFSAAGGATSRQSGVIGLNTAVGAEASDPYYRPPRKRANTVETFSPAVRSRGSWASAGWTTTNTGESGRDEEMADQRLEPVGRSPVAEGQETYDDPRVSRTDYAVREVDYYYGIRGPALSGQPPTRRLKTGPADPTGPAASAAGWFKGLFGGKTKEKGKGFEVVRSSRAPPQMMPRDASGKAIAQQPETPGEQGGAAPRALNISDGEDEPVTRGAVEDDDDDDDDDEVSSVDSDDDEADARNHRVSAVAPSLPGLEPIGGIELPSRITSKASSRRSKVGILRSPTIPRKSSKRQSSSLLVNTEPSPERLATIPGGPVSPDEHPHVLYDPHKPRHKANLSVDSSRFPFGSVHTKSSRVSGDGQSATSSNPPVSDEEGMVPGPGHARHSSSALGRLAPPIRAEPERPTSMGYVQQYRTGDMLHAGEEHQGSSAEFVENARRNSTSPGERSSWMRSLLFSLFPLVGRQMLYPFNYSFPWP